MPDGEVPTLADASSYTPMVFQLKDLEVGKPDPRGRIVRDILWAVNEFKIYKTDRGISPFFSDNPDAARTQKLAYLELGAGIAEFNHLIHTLKPPLIPFTDKAFPMIARSEGNLVHYERELARCIAEALLGKAEVAKTSLLALQQRLAAQIANRGRVVHLLVNIVLVAVAVFGALSFARSEYTSAFQFDVSEIGLAVMMGAIGALFSTTVRLQSMAVDPTITHYMHWVYASQRVLVGALGALIIYFGFKSGVISGLFAQNTETAKAFDTHWLSFVGIIAGFSERLVPNLLDGKSQSATDTE